MKIRKGELALKATILTFAQHLKQLYAQNFQNLGNQYKLSQLEIDVLLFLYNNPEYNTARDICIIRGLAKSNVSNAVEALRRRGYLDSKPDTKSRRIHRLYLCDGTKQMMEELSACQLRYFEMVLDGFTQEETDLFRQFLMRVDQNIVNILKQEGTGKEG